jgi:hypothetical protein
MTKMVLALVCAAALLFALDAARAAEPEGGAAASKAGEGAKAKAGEGEAGKSEEGEAGKPDEGGPDEGDEGGEGEGQPGGNGTPVPLAELTKDGFVIRTTNFIPADAVTHQSGKVSSDAVIVTLQKSTSTAVCFYTLKAYVGKKLTTIPACTVHH